MAASAATAASARLSSGSAARGSFAPGGCAQVGSSSSSWRGTEVAATTSFFTRRQQHRKPVVVSPRNVSDSPVVAEACLDPDASRVRPTPPSPSLFFQPNCSSPTLPRFHTHACLNSTFPLPSPASPDKISNQEQPCSESSLLNGLKRICTAIWRTPS
jgi:hypothetical protein